MRSLVFVLSNRSSLFLCPGDWNRFSPLSLGRMLYNEAFVKVKINNISLVTESRMGPTAAARRRSSAPGRSDEDDEEADEMGEEEDKEPPVEGRR